MIPSMASAPSLVAAASAAAAGPASASSTAAAAVADVSSSILGNKGFVGSAWIISSALLTTYSTTSFLKYSGPGIHDEMDGISNPKKNKNAFGDFWARLKRREKEQDDGTVDVVSIESNRSGNALSRPTLLTLYRFAGSLFLGLIFHQPLLAVMDRIGETVASVPLFALPATFLFVANYANSISLDRIGISLTYTSKCGIPLITVLLTLLLDGPAALPSTLTLMTLIPIAMGIAAASWAHPTFEPIGFAAAMLSCVAQAALNISSKKVMTASGITGADAQRAMVCVALLITLSMSVVNHIRHVSKDPALEGEKAKMVEMTMDHTTKKVPKDPPAWLAWFAVVSYHVEYILSFMFVKLVEPITYGTCDAIRRLAIIVSGHKMFGGEPFSKLNLAGIGMSLLGALAFALSSAKTVAKIKP